MSTYRAIPPPPRSPSDARFWVPMFKWETSRFAWTFFGDMRNELDFGVGGDCWERVVFGLWRRVR